MSEFQPLTLSVEEWDAIKVDTSENWTSEVVRECEAQAQAAADLRQRLEELNDNATKAIVEATREKNDLRAHRSELFERIESLKDQLEQAQQERDAQSKMTLYQCELAEERWLRAVQAEAALDEMHDWLIRMAEGSQHEADGSDRIYLGVLAELQRRRSAPGKDRKGELT